MQQSLRQGLQSLNFIQFTLCSESQSSLLEKTTRDLCMTNKTLVVQELVSQSHCHKWHDSAANLAYASRSSYGRAAATNVVLLLMVLAILTQFSITQRHHNVCISHSSLDWKCVSISKHFNSVVFYYVWKFAVQNSTIEREGNRIAFLSAPTFPSRLI